ncbi:class I SAM-dependent methyltransferase [Spiroplasma sp. SV19]|uniref:class I SAM-dependent methyltransferase n=1 Tax=Spiroplasma sp. SV19 TaxID=2570468 RepID=UPI0024B83D88|nr:class I SAM-dependent methyltransferase [Spiroplasma sp. SV19]WHQ37400.1 methyltransferase [Spiroplasma sp. SV19]
MKGYILKTGEHDEERLDSLFDVYNQGSQEFIKENVKKKNIKIIFDIGCGQGSMSMWFANYFPNCQVYGIDNSNEQIVIFNDKLKAYQNVHSFLGDITNKEANFKAIGKADLIYSRYLLLHLKDWESFFDNLYHLLNNHGTLIIEEPGFPWTSYPELKNT